MTPAALFHRACTALFGDHYRTPMAKALKLRRVESIDDWASGRSEIPAGVWGEIEGLLLAREEECAAVVEEIVAMADVASGGKSQ